MITQGVTVLALFDIFGYVFDALLSPPFSVFMSFILLCFGLVYIKYIFRF